MLLAWVFELGKMAQFTRALSWWCKLALHNIHTIMYDIENKEGTYMYGMKSVHYGFHLERWLKDKMSLFCEVMHIFRQLRITP